jgi:hypothetical protein
MLDDSIPSEGGLKVALLERWNRNLAQNPKARIRLQAAVISWVVCMGGLLAWTFYNLMSEGTLSTPFILLCIILLVFFGSLLYLRKRTPPDSN